MPGTSLPCPALSPRTAALLSALPLLLALAPPAAAGHWNFHATGTGSASITYDSGSDGTRTISQRPWAPPTDRSGSLSLPAYSESYQASAPGDCHATLTVKASITATWVPDGSSDDTPPPSVEVVETGQAQYAGGNGDGSPVSGGADDGLGDAVDAGGVSQTPGGVVPPPHLTPETGGSFTLTRTFTAHADTAAGGAGTMCWAGAYLGSYTISIHAQPYNWQLADEYTMNGNDLHFEYTWSSTTGDVRDLKTCYLHEQLSCLGQSNSYSYPYPFVGGPYQNPYYWPGYGVNGTLMTLGTDPDDYKEPSIQDPILLGVTMVTTQEFEFDDIATGDSDVMIPGSNINTITQSISDHNTSGAFWWYNCTGAGYSVTCPVQ